MTLAVTDVATTMLKELLDSTEHESEQVIRLVSNAEGNLGFVLDSERDGDQVVQHEGSPVLVIEPRLSEGLDGATLDVKDTENGYTWVLSGLSGE